MVRLKENLMADKARVIPRAEMGSSTTCAVCGKWPACLYVDYDNKNSGGRICEECAPAYERKDGRLILNKR